MPDVLIDDGPDDVRRDFSLLWEFVGPIAGEELETNRQLVPMGASLRDGGELALIVQLPEARLHEGQELSDRLLATIREDLDGLRAIVIVEDKSFSRPEGDVDGLQLSFEHRSGWSQAIVRPYTWKGRIKKRLEFGTSATFPYERRVWRDPE